MKPLLAFAPCALALAGCPSGNSAYDLGPRSSLTEEEAAAKRAACTFHGGGAQGGAWPGETIAKDAPLGPEIPIDTVVLIMMENRSFDQLLGNLPAVGVTDVDVARPDVTNPDEMGTPVSRYHDTDYCFDDTNHEWSGSHRQYNDGKMDGFVVTNKNGLGDPTGRRAMGYNDQTDLPFLYGLAANFAIGDRYFCSLLGPTFPNRLFFYGATSFGYTYNELLMTPLPNLPEALSAARIDWRVYSETFPGTAIFLDTYTKNLGDHYFKLDDFYVDAGNGELAPVTYIDPNLRDDGALRDDQHPPGDVQLGDQFLEKVIRAAMASKQWDHMAIFITWDEHGGLYDHVPPPAACPPDALPLKFEGAPSAGAFDRLGFRVPVIVVSPYARPKFVSHVVHDHTSILRFVEARFLLPAFTARDANADPMYEMFDFSKPALKSPPALPPAMVDQAKLDACKNLFPKGPPPDFAGLAPTDGGAGD
jgi:phospholipase C